MSSANLCRQLGRPHVSILLHRSSHLGMTVEHTRVTHPSRPSAHGVVAHHLRSVWCTGLGSQWSQAFLHDHLVRAPLGLLFAAACVLGNWSLVQCETVVVGRHVVSTGLALGAVKMTDCIARSFAFALDFLLDKTTHSACVGRDRNLLASCSASGTALRWPHIRLRPHASLTISHCSRDHYLCYYSSSTTVLPILHHYCSHDHPLACASILHRCRPCSLLGSIT